tara:strand:- start:145 stop:567 length:423 start_codon:yes stop_codon:yes gene_type:complete
MSKKYKAMVLSCIDPRFQSVVSDYLIKKKLKGKYSLFTIAGGAIGVTAEKFKKWHKTFLDNFEISLKIHKISKLIVINHRDCGAAKMVNRKNNLLKENELAVHINSFKKLKKVFKKKYPKIKIEFKLISSNHQIEEFKNF